jgi:hypothetical protein
MKAGHSGGVMLPSETSPLPLTTTSLPASMPVMPPDVSSALPSPLRPMSPLAWIVVAPSEIVCRLLHLITMLPLPSIVSVAPLPSVSDQRSILLQEDHAGPCRPAHRLRSPCRPRTSGTWSRLRSRRSQPAAASDRRSGRAGRSCRSRRSPSWKRTTTWSPVCLPSPGCKASRDAVAVADVAGLDRQPARLLPLRLERHLGEMLVRVVAGDDAVLLAVATPPPPLDGAEDQCSPYRRHEAVRPSWRSAR